MKKTHRDNLKREADKPVNERWRAIKEWRLYRRSPFWAETWQSRLVRPTTLGRGSWLYRRIMQYKNQLPWCVVEWSICRNVLPQYEEHAKVAGVCIETYMANLVKLEKLKREGWYCEGQ